MALFAVRVRKFERGLLFREGDFVRMLAPGKYRLWRRVILPSREAVQIVSTLKTRFEHPLLDALIEQPSLREALEIVNLTESQRALVWTDGRLHSVLGPGRYAFWKAPYTLKIEVFDVSSLRLEHAQVEAIVAHKDAPAFLDGVEVGPEEDVLLFRNGVLVDTLGQGKHIFWKGAGRIRWKEVDRREQVAEVSGQEIMTNDKVTLRVNLVVTFQVSDAVKAVTTVTDYAQSVYREAQLALRASVGARTLDALLTDKESIGGEVMSALRARTAEFGVAVRAVGLRDIILPGEMKTILNQVIAAEKQAQADLIRRREETASARSQANTARLLAENPMLARVRELELLQNVLAGTKATFVFGSGDLAGQVRSLLSADGAKETK